jgi:hypothetical protein
MKYHKDPNISAFIGGMIVFIVLLWAVTQVV